MTPVAIIHSANGSIHGANRFQALAYFLTRTGLANHRFYYQPPGLLSPSLKYALDVAVINGEVLVTTHSTECGGTYDQYTLLPAATLPEHEMLLDPLRSDLSLEANKYRVIPLVIAATALHLHAEGHEQPWDETKQHQPDLATPENLLEAAEFLKFLHELSTPTQAPHLPAPSDAPQVTN